MTWKKLKGLRLYQILEVAGASVVKRPATLETAQKGRHNREAGLGSQLSRKVL